MSSTRDTDYSRAIRAAIKQWIHGEITLMDYLARCEHVAAAHDRMEDRARFAKEMAAIKEAQHGAPAETR